MDESNGSLKAHHLISGLVCNWKKVKSKHSDHHQVVELSMQRKLSYWTNNKKKLTKCHGPFCDSFHFVHKFIVFYWMYSFYSNEFSVHYIIIRLSDLLCSRPFPYNNYLMRQYDMIGFPINEHFSGNCYIQKWSRVVAICCKQEGRITSRKSNWVAALPNSHIHWWRLNKKNIIIPSSCGFCCCYYCYSCHYTPRCHWPVFQHINVTFT